MPENPISAPYNGSRAKRNTSGGPISSILQTLSARRNRVDTMMMDMMTYDNLWLFLLPILFGPFVQEDIAVIGAAGLSVNNPAFTPYIFVAILIGLFLSDIWKYWPGAAARTSRRANRYAQKPKVAEFARRMKHHAGKTLFTVRFLPLARIPAYVAAGFIKVPYWRFCAWIFVSALTYIILFFCIFHALGEVAGKTAKIYVPIIAVGILALLAGGLYIRRRIMGTKPKNDPH